MGPREKPNIIVLKEQRNKMAPNDILLYPELLHVVVGNYHKEIKPEVT